MNRTLTSFFDRLQEISNNQNLPNLVIVGWVFMAFFVISQTVWPQNSLIATGQAGVLLGVVGMAGHIMATKRSRLARTLLIIVGLPAFLLIFTLLFIAVARP